MRDGVAGSRHDAVVAAPPLGAMEASTAQWMLATKVCFPVVSPGVREPGDDPVCRVGRQRPQQAFTQMMMTLVERGGSALGRHRTQHL